MSDFWDREVIEKQHMPWMAIPEVRVYLNSLIGNGELLWPIEWFERFLAGRTFDRALSVGCGSGALERELVQRGLCRTVDAFDGSVVSLREARREADRLPFGDRIRYFAANFNEPALPKARYDAVFFHQSAHHVAKLEKVYRAIMRALKPGGIVYFDEYVGPSRLDWDAHRQLLEPHRRIFDQLPRSLRSVDQLNVPIQADDPSEAFRSSEIESQLAIGFDVIERVPYGGGILSVIMPNLRAEALDPATLQRLIDEDRAATAFYTLIVAKPKRGVRGAIARARYWFEPKAKRVVRMIRRSTRARPSPASYPPTRPSSPRDSAADRRGDRSA